MNENRSAEQEAVGQPPLAALFSIIAHNFNLQPAINGGSRYRGCHHSDVTTRNWSNARNTNSIPSGIWQDPVRAAVAGRSRSVAFDGMEQECGLRNWRHYTESGCRSASGCRVVISAMPDCNLLQMHVLPQSCRLDRLRFIFIPDRVVWIRSIFCLENLNPRPGLTGWLSLPIRLSFQFGGFDAAAAGWKTTGKTKRRGLPRP